MAKVFPPVRSESRILVELYSLENAAHEITSTIYVSSHGARVLTRAPGRPIRMFPFVQSPAISIRVHTAFIANPFRTVPFPSG
jgi:hypothetical protein